MNNPLCPKCQGEAKPHCQTKTCEWHMCRTCKVTIGPHGAVENKTGKRFA